jgi:hypothetical protein
LRAAKAAGMTTVLVPNVSVPPAAGSAAFADLTVDRLADLHLDRFHGSDGIDGSPAARAQQPADRSLAR